MIVLIDNYDSFTYNVYQLFKEFDEVKVFYNDQITIDEILDLNPNCIVISPGPSRPSDAGICLDLIKKVKGKIPLLGICLGHQAICQCYGATITYAKTLMHGKTSVLEIDEDSNVFKNCKRPIQVGRYHSLIAKEDTLPSALNVIAHADGQVMAVVDIKNKVYGLQFHPESILTLDGKQMIQNIMEEIL